MRRVFLPIAIIIALATLAAVASLGTETADAASEETHGTLATPACYTICRKSGVNYGGGVLPRQPIAVYERARMLGMGWILEIVNGPDQLPQTVEYINRAHDHGLTPIIRICDPNNCGFTDPSTYADFLRQVDTQVAGEFWAIIGPNEPDLEPWVPPDGSPEAVAVYMNAVLADLESGPPTAHLRTLSPAFNITNGATHNIFRRMERAGARFADLDGFAGNSYSVAGNSAYYYYAKNTGHAEKMRQKVQRYGKQIVFTEWGTFGMFDKPGEDHPGRPRIVNELRSQYLQAANDPTVMGILHFDAFKSGPNQLFDPELITITQGAGCAGVDDFNQAGVGYSTSQTVWQINGENACRIVAYGCPFLSGAACDSSQCIDTDGDGYTGAGGICARTDCDDNDPGAGQGCGGGEQSAGWGTVHTVLDGLPVGGAAVWPNLVFRQDGNPFIAYHDPTIGVGDLMALACQTDDCRRAFRQTVDYENNTGLYPSLAIRQDGTPFIAYLDVTDYDFEVISCLDADCTGYTHRIIEDVTGLLGFGTSTLIRPDGRPGIAYYHSDAQDINFYNCSDAACTDGSDITIASNNTRGQFPSIALGPNGLPYIAYRYQAYSLVALNQCNNANCTSTSYRELAYDDTRPFSPAGLVIRSDSRPASLGWRPSGSDRLIILAICNDAACGGAMRRTIETFTAAGFTPTGSLAIFADDSLFLAYTISDGAGGSDLRLVRCLALNCSSTVTDLLTAGNPQMPHVVLGPDGSPVVLYHDATDGALKLYRVDLALTGSDPAIRASRSSLAISEDGLQDTYAISLQALPSAPVQIDLTAGDGVQLSLDDETYSALLSLTFDSTNWDQPQTVHVQAVDDLIDQGLARTSVIGHQIATGSAPEYEGIAIDPVKVSIEDNDTAAVTLLAPLGTVSSAQPAFHWAEAIGATDYYVWVNGPGGAVFDGWQSATLCTDGICILEALGDLPNGNYTWWVQPRMGSFAGVRTGTGSFTINYVPPVIPVPLIPDGPTNDSDPIYRWNAVSGALSYDLQVLDQDSQIVISENYLAGPACTGSICSATPPALPADGSYAWEVRAIKAGGPGAWSAPLAFMLDTVAPQFPVQLFSPTHLVGEPSNIMKIAAGWSADAEDGDGSGVAGYSIEWSTMPDYLPDTVIDTAGDTLEATSPTLASGDWYIHLRVCDHARNCSAPLRLGPFPLDKNLLCHSLTAMPSTAAGGIVSVEGAPNCNNGLGYLDGTSLEITLDLATGYRFVGWSGDASGLDNPLSYVMESNSMISAGVLPLAPLDNVDIATGAGSPATVTLTATGYLPDRCHRLAGDVQTRDGDTVTVDLLMAAREGSGCSPTIRPYTYTVVLEGTFSSGSYFLILNGLTFPFAVP